MKDYTLSQQYAIIGLDGLESLHMNTAKRAVLRAVAAARLLEEIMADLAGAAAVTEQTVAGQADPAALEAVLQRKLEEGLLGVRRQSKKEAQELEQEIAGLLKADGVLEEAPDLLACDMNYYTAGVDLRAYRSDRTTYLGITERLRAEVLEEGPMTPEGVCLLWLLRESGCIHDLFSTEEQQELQNKMVGETAGNAGYRMLWQAQFHSGLENLVRGFLKGKTSLFRNPFLEGVNLLYPFLDRRQAIFIDFVIFGTNVADRRMAVLHFLTEKGHYVEEVRYGTETLLRVDNAYYRIWPKTVSCSRVPIQGAELLPVYK